MSKTARIVRAPSYAEALAEFRPEYREIVDEFASGEEGNWNRRFCVRYSPALALQLAIDPSLEHSRWLLDEHYPFDRVAKEARLEVTRHTRAAYLDVVDRRVKRKINPLSSLVAL